MSLIKSISGIRGTIGGLPEENLTPIDIIRFATAYALFLKKNYPNVKIKTIIGRDSRISGEMVKDLVIGALLSQGINVIELGMATTPTVEMAVSGEKAQGGIIITASHNPQGWNALKLLNAQGEFLSKADGEEVLRLAAENNFISGKEEELGYYVFSPFLSREHLRTIGQAPLVAKDLIAAKNFKIVVDGINSIGGKAVPNLLKMLGVRPENIIELNCDLSGRFAHQPEPLAANLTQIMETVIREKADLGIVVDPDVDRLAFIDENGLMFGEEYTLVAVADYVLKNYDILMEQLGDDGKKYKKASVSNLSSSRALKDITEKQGGVYEAATVGEVNVVQKMKEIKAIIGGEGNGGVIYPPLHYGRDALIGSALFLTALAASGQKMSEYKKNFPEYFMVKDKIELAPNLNLPETLEKIKDAYRAEKITAIDGVKIDWPDSWVHLRASNTEPIIRIYAEAKTLATATAKVKEIKDKILAYIK
ncbi:MAG: phosphoglucosamine mutase [Patescibacteria group bacterium]